MRAKGTNMRLIEQQMNNAITTKAAWFKDNTRVRYSASDNTSHVRLFGNHIAYYDHTNGTIVCNLRTLSEHPTNTTKSRLRALGVDVYTRKGITYVNDKEVI